MSDIYNEMTLDEVLRAARGARDAILDKTGSRDYRDVGAEAVEQLKLIATVTGIDYHGRLVDGTFIPEEAE